VLRGQGKSLSTFVRAVPAGIRRYKFGAGCAGPSTTVSTPASLGVAVAGKGARASLRSYVAGLLVLTMPPEVAREQN
jgi:hypothetical protein